MIILVTLTLFCIFFLCIFQCPHCNNPSGQCFRRRYRRALRAYARAQGLAPRPPTMHVNARSLLHSNARRKLYYYYATELRGIRGMSRHVPVPLCVQNLIRSWFPDPNSNYRGFAAWSAAALEWREEMNDTDNW